jgi:hypothetical protein
LKGAFSFFRIKLFVIILRLYFSPFMGPWVRRRRIG